MAISRDNHYVPEWYQKGFLHKADPKYFYLDRISKVIKLSDGSTKTINGPRHFSPSQCFCQHDLYTTSILASDSDFVEKYLFGKIDSQGAEAVRAVTQNNYPDIHRHCLHFFEYIDV